MICMLIELLTEYMSQKGIGHMSIGINFDFCRFRCITIINIKILSISGEIEDWVTNLWVWKVFESVVKWFENCEVSWTYEIEVSYCYVYWCCNFFLNYMSVFISWCQLAIFVVVNALIVLACCLFQEIIEFPVLKVNGKTFETEAEFHQYVQPEVHKNLTQFCTEVSEYEYLCDTFNWWCVQVTNVCEELGVETARCSIENCGRFDVILSPICIAVHIGNIILCWVTSVCEKDLHIFLSTLSAKTSVQNELGFSVHQHSKRPEICDIACETDQYLQYCRLFQ